MTRDELIAFENEMAERFNAGEIRAPLHLAGGNEDALIGVFKNILARDYIFCAWRSHYHCLLKGVPVDLLRTKILDGRSIALCFKEYKILSSALVGGICPIAVGVAWTIKQRKGSERVWCFIGDMTRRAGITQECIEYAHGHDLPVTWVVEDNGLSVCTDTREVWGAWYGDPHQQWEIMSYDYKLARPHVGTGKFVSF